MRIACSSTSKDRVIISPYGGYPGYISHIIENFNRAGEKAFLVGFSHDFDLENIDGLSFFTNYAIGYDAVNSGDGSSLPNQREFDITVDYRPENTKARGL